MAVYILRLTPFQEEVWWVVSNEGWCFGTWHATQCIYPSVLIQKYLEKMPAMPAGKLLTCGIK